MSTHPTKLDVEFEKKDPGDEFRGDVPTKHVFDQNYDNYFETFVREVLQNSNDAGPNNPEEPVRVQFKFRRITDTELKEFRKAINWDDLSKHYDAIAGEDHSLRVEQYLDYLEDGGDLLALVVEDRNTSGLAGDEDAQSGETPYTSLVRDWQVTYKQDASAGGSHGVGKSVLWASSALSTVFFASTVDGNDASPRLVGRSILPDHYLEDEHRAGKGWLGIKDSSSPVSHPVSLWNGDAESLAPKLSLDRPDEPGTSILIPGFCSPVGELDVDINEIVEEFVTAAVKNFWPAIYNDNLRVTVVEPDGTEHEADLDAVPEVRPFVECFENRFDADEELTDPGSVAKRTIDFEFTESETGDEYEGEADVFVRMPQPGEEEQGLTNSTAIFRGSGMVVDYVSMNEPAAYGHPYHAILVAGNARGWGAGTLTDEDEAVDDFLKAAEPASHTHWGSTPLLKKKYDRGCVGTAKSLQGDALRKRLVDVVEAKTERAGTFVEAVANDLPDLDDVDAGGTGSSSDDDDRSGLNKDYALDFDGDNWVFDGWSGSKSDEDDEWYVEIAVVKKGDDNATAGYEDIEEISSPTTGVSIKKGTVEKGSHDVVVGKVTLDRGVTEFEFEGSSTKITLLNPWSGHGGDTDLKVRKKRLGW